MNSLSWAPFCGSLGGRPEAHMNPWLRGWKPPLPASSGEFAWWQGSSGMPLYFVHIHFWQERHGPWMGKALLYALRFWWPVPQSEKPQREFKFTFPLSLLEWGMRVISLSRPEHIEEEQTLALLRTNNFNENIRTQFSVPPKALTL